MRGVCTCGTVIGCHPLMVNAHVDSVEAAHMFESQMPECTGCARLHLPALVDAGHASISWQGSNASLTHIVSIDLFGWLNHAVSMEERHSTKSCGVDRF